MDNQPEMSNDSDRNNLQMLLELDGEVNCVSEQSIINDDAEGQMSNSQTKRSIIEVPPRVNPSVNPNNGMPKYRRDQQGKLRRVLSR